MKRIEFGELRIGDIARQHINDCLTNNWISMGEKVELLEERFAALMNCKYGIATSSGTSSITAITLALPEMQKMRKVNRYKSKIICPALGFIANSTGIVSGFLSPKWVDIKPDTLNIDEDLVEDAIDDDVVAIYCIGTMGRPCEMSKLKKIADKYDLILFEDSCENYGSRFDNKLSHKYAIAGCSSFYQAHLIQSGEGSVIYTDNEELKDLLISIRSHGRIGKSAYFSHVRFGSNFKMTDICASIALEGVEYFYDNIKIRTEIWKSLVDFSNKFNDFAWFSSTKNNINTMPHGFSITIKPNTKYNINNLKSVFDKYNIHYKKNFGYCGSHPALSIYNPIDYEVKYKNAIYCGENGVHIGCHAYLTIEDVSRIKAAIEEFFVM